MFKREIPPLKLQPSRNEKVTSVPISKATFRIVVDWWGWRDDTVGKNTDCSSKGPKFNCQHPHGTSQLCLAPVLGDMMPTYRHTCTCNTNAHKIKKSTE